MAFLVWTGIISAKDPDRTKMAQVWIDSLLELRACGTSDSQAFELKQEVTPLARLSAEEMD